MIETLELIELPALLTIVVPGKPKSQGSMTLWRAKDSHGAPIEGEKGERAKYEPDVVNHRNWVVDRLTIGWAGRGPLTGALAVRCRFQFERPKSHYLPANSKRLVPELREDAPLYMAQMPDTDKLLRLVLDAGTIAGLYSDDAQCAVVRGEKVWGPRHSTTIEVWEL